MNKGEFKKRLKNIKLNQEKFAKLTGYAYSTVKGWETPPKWVGYVLGYIEIVQKINEIDKVADNIRLLKEKVQKLDL
jgi:DNA-binding transcriptional regulator YiaG